jgi:biotin operon repressor
MSKGKKFTKAQKKAELGEQYTTLSYVLLKSVAWRTLQGGSIKVFMELRTKFYGTNNGKLSLSMADASKTLNMSKSTVHRAFRELEERGFIINTKKGRFYGRTAAEWQLADRSCNGFPAQNTWKQWQPPKLEKQKSVPEWDILGRDGSV